MKKSIFVLLSLVLFSCSNVDFQSSDEKKVQSTDNVLIENLNSEIILGEKIYNPYTVDEVQARSTTNEEIEPNFIYFRCRSDKDEDILWLKEKFDFLSIIPLDREIIEGGTDLVKLIESWGYFSENYAMNWKYGGNTNLSRNYLNELEYNKKGDNMKHFYYGGFYDLMDDNNKIDQNYQIEKAKDFCSGFSYQNLYKALTTDAISTKEQFAEKLVDITNRENEYNNVLKTLALNCEE